MGQSDASLNKEAYNKVIYLNVGGETISTTHSTLNYIPNTKLSLINNWPRDNRNHVFLDLPPELFKHFFHQLRRWSIRDNRSASPIFEPPSWKVKDEFNEMLIALGFQKHLKSMLTATANFLAILVSVI